MNQLDNGTQIKNMEAALHDAGFQIVQDLKQYGGNRRLIEKALGVLAHDGLYACYVFCQSQNKKSGKKYSEILVDQPIREIAKMLNEKVEDPKTYLTQCSKNLNKLLLVKEMLEKVFIYARYHAKAELEAGDE